MKILSTTDYVHDFPEYVRKIICNRIASKPITLLRFKLLKLLVF